MKQHYDVKWVRAYWWDQAHDIYQLMDGCATVASVYYKPSSDQYTSNVNHVEKFHPTLAAAKRAAITRLVASTEEL